MNELPLALQVIMTLLINILHRNFTILRIYKIILTINTDQNTNSGLIEIIAIKDGILFISSNRKSEDKSSTLVDREYALYL